MKGEIEQLPERGAVQHMLVDSGALLRLGLADLLHRRSGEAPGRRLAIVLGESMEYDGQAPAQMTLESGMRDFRRRS